MALLNYCRIFYEQPLIVNSILSYKRRHFIICCRSKGMERSPVAFWNLCSFGFRFVLCGMFLPSWYYSMLYFIRSIFVIIHGFLALCSVSIVSCWAVFNNHTFKPKIFCVDLFEAPDTNCAVPENSISYYSHVYKMFFFIQEIWRGSKQNHQNHKYLF